MSLYKSNMKSIRTLFKNFVCLFFVLFVSYFVFAQEDREIEILDSIYYFNHDLLSETDKVALRSIPPLKIHINNDVHLPSAVNNGGTTFFPYIFYQAALECGQASSITYGLTYETAIRRGYTDIQYNRNHHFTGYFAWNFCNGGVSTGVSFLDTWQVVRTAGSPMMPYWGAAYQEGGATRWLNGYDGYYDAMRNRIVEMMAIPTDSEEGINILKHWLYDHGCGTQYGGIANFYSTYRSSDATLPAGTPEEGFALMSTFSSAVNHSQTIVGYNDSIRYDFNGDGLYTNNIDLNGDGVVNVKDWEIGGVIFCNTFGQAFGTNGFCYMPYRLLALLPAEGGIWNKCVYVVRLRDEVNPQITAKATVKHDTRNMLKITAGVASNVNATAPEHTLDLNIFNYQGGAMYMQGESMSENFKTLEFGLDLSPLLNYITPNSPAKFFLKVDENDPSGIGTGQIINFSIMNYTGTSVVEIPCSQTNVNIANNSTTLLSISTNIQFSKPTIQTENIVIQSFEEISEQLEAVGGVPNYRWELKKEYTIEEFSDTYPSAGNSAVTLSNTSSGYATIDLPFSFPCFDETYSQIVIYADGYITFRHDTYNWPFLKNSDLQVRTTRMIAPFRSNLTNVSVSKSTTEHYILLTVTGNISSQNSNSVKYAVKLYDTGIIEIYYGNMSYTGNDFYAVHSRGDALCFQYLPISGENANTVSNRCFRLTPPKSIEGIELYEDGSLRGKVTRAFENQPLDVVCYDNNDVIDSKTIYVNALYPAPLFISNIEIDANGKEAILPGDTVLLTLTIQNVDTITLYGCQLKFMCENPSLSFIDSVEYFGSIASGSHYILNNAIKFVIAPNTPFGYIFDVNTLITNDNQLPSEDIEHFTISDVDIEITDLSLLDLNNNTLDPNEIVTCNATLRNNSNFLLNNVEITLRFEDPNITIINPTLSLSALSNQSNQYISYEISTNSSFNPGDVIDAYFDIYTNNILITTQIITLYCNHDCFNFESSDQFSQFTTDANASWYIFEESANSGNYSMASATIGHDESSNLFYSHYFEEDVIFSFYSKTSTESNYDFLKFFIDGELADSWSGTQSWSLQEFDVDSGMHTFKWQFIKDNSVSSNLDKVWIDDICITPNSDILPEIQISPMEVNIIMDKNTILDTTLVYSSVSDNYLLFNNEILDSDGLPQNWLSVNYQNGSINSFDSRNIILTFNSFYKASWETYNANLFVYVDNGNSITIPISMTVESPIGIQENDSFHFSAYPNPTHSVTKIDLSHCAVSLNTLIIRDIQGKLLSTQTIEGNLIVVDLEKFSNGIYLVELRGKDFVYPPIKIIKN